MSILKMITALFISLQVPAAFSDAVIYNYIGTGASPRIHLELSANGP